ncbi:hypothetical protein WN55_08541 [Dufourea novaeangliae]|uniref:Uncharacterized protein n=1 Tax=Dufourea novaeangliae TaxID=178035 RepID=A0A154P5F5_DUFNO|nr:hypothetical protein WN55_08541 [Dufourea novaeangliae]
MRHSPGTRARQKNTDLDESLNGRTIGRVSTVYTVACVDQRSSASRVHRLPVRGASSSGSKPHLSRYPAVSSFLHFTHTAAVSII